MMKTKVAFLCLSHYQGGMELDAIRHTHLFNRNGIDSVLICRKGTFLENKASEQNTRQFTIDFKSKFSIRLIQQLRNIILRENITTLIFFGASEMKSIYFAVKGTNCKVIVRHGTTKSSSKKDVIHRLLYSCVDNYVAISEHLHKNILKILPAKEKQVHTIYTSIDQDNITNYSPNQPKFIFVGRVEEGKGIFDAIKALVNAKIPSSSKEITIAGSVNQEVRFRLERLADSGMIKLNFIGYVDNISDYYRKNAFFLFPSYGEGLPNVVLEALNNGLACITYNNTVFPEFLDLGFSHFYQAEDKNIISLASKIEEAYNNFSSEQKNPHKDTLIKYFNEKACITQWENLIE